MFHMINYEFDRISFSTNRKKISYILNVKFLIAILLTSSIFAQKEYNIDNIYDQASDKVYIKKFSNEVVDENV